MRNLVRITPIIVLVVLSFFTTKCKKDDPAKLATVVTTPVTNVTTTTATGGGNITSNGGAEILANGVCWSVNVNPSTADSKTVDGIGAAQFVSSLNSLIAGSTYHVRAYATNSVGTAYGADLSFTTLGQAPSGVTMAANNITATTATLNGTVNANNLSTVVTFEYGTSTSYGSTVTASQSPVSGNTITNVSADISGLTGGTIYHFRIKTVNSIGTTYGEDMTLVTLGQAPTASTQSANSISTTGAILNGTVNANNSTTTVTFEYGISTSYGNTVTATQSPVTGSSLSNVNTSISGLTAGTTYHFRVRAVNSLGSVYGDDMTFTTLSIPTNGLIAEWLFEDNLSDSKPSGTPYNLNIIQGSTSYLTGKIGKALYLDGATKINNTNQNLVTFINNKNPWTINFWFKYKGGLKPYIMGAKHLISVDQLAYANPFKRIWIQAGELLDCESENFNYEGLITLYSINRIDDDKWYFASITQDGSFTRMYIDNILQDEKTSVNLGTDPLEAFVIGSCSSSDWPTRDFYDGYIDQLRVYNRVLTSSEMGILINEMK